MSVFRFTRQFPIVFLAAVAGAQQSGGPQSSVFEGQPAITLANDKVQFVVMAQGSAIASAVMNDDADKLNPLWNPMQLARNNGRQAQYTGTLGHLVCVDGFGQPSAEERAAGIPQHGEAHITKLNVIAQAANGGTSTVSLSGTLPIVQEVFTRTFRMVDGESVMYVDSQLENLMGFDRPVNWAEHATIASPFVQSGATTISLSGTRSQNRPYPAPAAGRGGPAAPGGPAPAAGPGAPGGPAAAGGRGANGGRGFVRRLASGQDFTWPIAPGADGQPVDMSTIPENPHYNDNAATLMDPSRQLEFVAALNTVKHTVYGYVFRREDYPWLQHWANFTAENQLVRGVEFGTQPYDISHREVLNNGPLFDTPTYRWLPAKSKIETHFLVFYTRVPEAFKKVDDVRLENGRIVIEDRGARQQVTLAASRGLQP